MAGGLLQLVANGQANTILTGNPTTTFFKAVYKHHTPFGLQRFRMDYNGLRNLAFDAPTEFNFKIPRYAEMLWDTYVVLNLPDIWSPLYDTSYCNTYNFKWIKNVGFNMIKQITINSGGGILAQYSGEWMQNAINRDDVNKKGLIDRMVGNIPELYDPKSGYTKQYPNAFKPRPPSPASGECEPSIRGRQLYIPLMAWFCNSTKTALPLIALQYQEININIEFRSVKELFTIQKPDKSVLAPNSADIQDQMWRFIQEPPITDKDKTVQDITALYKNRRNDWNTDIHLIGTYIFLGDEERRVMAAQESQTLIKMQYEWDYLNTTGSTRVDVPSRDMVSSYMWRFRRSDVGERNEWSNYQNYMYEDANPIFPLYDISGHLELPSKRTLKFTGPRKIKNIKDIMIDMALLCGQDYRETTHNAGVYSYVEKWNRTTGIAKDGLFCYNFCTNTNRLVYQPTGAQNTNKWKHLTFEFNTIHPPQNLNNEESLINVMCDPSGNIIGVRKNIWEMNAYNYDLRIFEERYNIIEIMGGRIGLMSAR
tara:strand:+ start:27609 stop:29219 length:1611 start_codon:yes stop_codon:yes gene_type:complete